MSNSAAITCIIFMVRFLGCGYRSKCAAVSSLGKRLLSFGRRLCLLDQESAEIRMGEYRRRAVGGDLRVPTRVWSRFFPRQEPALRSPLTELPLGQEAWIWSSTDSISSSRTQALAIRRLSLTYLYSLAIRVLGFPNRSRETAVERVRAESGEMAAGVRQVAPSYEAIGYFPRKC